MLRVVNVDKSFVHKRRNISVLEGVNYNFPSTGLVFILGKSGSGKSTLLNLIGGLDVPTKGSIYYNEQSLAQLTKEELATYRNNNIGFIFQDFNLLDNLNVLENISLSLKLKNQENKEQVIRIMEMLEIKHLQRRKVKELSGGEKARVGIARALIKNPSIILADEATGNLDATTGEVVFNILKKISKDRLVIVVSHDEASAQKYGDILLYLEDKTIKREIKRVDLPYGDLKNDKTKHSLSLRNVLSFSKSLFTKNLGRYMLLLLIMIFSFTLFNITTFIPNININRSHAEALILNNKYDISIYKKIERYIYNANISSFNTQELNDLTNYLDTNNYSYYVNTSFYSNNVLVELMYYDIYRVELPEIYAFVKFGGYSEANIIFYPTNSTVLNDYDYIGRFPSGPNEIMVSNILAYFIINYGVYDNLGNPYLPSSNEDIIEDGVAIDFNGNYFVITGIYDYPDFDFEEFSQKEIQYKQTEFGMEVEYDEETSQINKEFGKIFVNTNFFEISTLIPNTEIDKTIYNEYLKINDEYIYLGYDNMAYTYQGEEYILNDNEIIINANILDLLTNNDFSNSYQEELGLTKEEYAREYIVTNNIINSYIEYCIRDKYLYNSETEYHYYTLKIVGIIINEEENNPKYYLSDNVISDYLLPNSLNKTISVIETDEDRIITLLEEYPINEGKYRISTDYSFYISDTIPLVNKITNLSSIFILLSLIITIGLFLLFTSFLLLLMRKTIGILTSLGATSKDIKKIILSLSVLLLVIGGGISILTSIFGIRLINNFISTKMEFTINYLYFNNYLYLYLGILIVILMVLSLFPIGKYLKKDRIKVLRKKAG